MLLAWIVVSLFIVSSTAEGALAGGRPNSFSGGTNAFAGVANPANAVWIPNRWDVGSHWIHQKSSLFNHDDNPLFSPGKNNTSYKTNNLYNFDAAITRQVKFTLGSQPWEGSISLAIYSAPNRLAVKTKDPIPLLGTTPLVVKKDTKVFSTIFAVKINKSHSLGFSLDYFYLSYLREGNQNSDNPLRSESPGHVTNNGTDHSGGLGLSLGWHWKITPALEFGLAWIKKSYVGQLKKYRGFEPHHAKNYIPQSVGSGFGYRFTSKLRGRLEVLWINFGNLPGANSAILSNGELNRNKRGSNKSPGPGLQDATLINLGFGYKVNSYLSFGTGYSHRLQLSKPSSIIISHAYRIQTIYDILSFGTNFKYKKHDFFLTFSRGFKNRVKGSMPTEIGGGKFSSEKSNTTAFFSWGYLY